MKNKKEPYDLVIVGGGAAGFFCAIQCAEMRPDSRILILEKSDKVLAKVRVSGGGRCNVTHACFDPSEMVQNYPRGEKELLGPFHRYLGGDMMAWLADHEVETKIEEDGRVFPISDNSQTIIDCFMECCTSSRIQIKKKSAVKEIFQNEGIWEIKCQDESHCASKVLIATGSSPAMWKVLKEMGHKIIAPVPSLFTFNIKSPLLDELPGVSVPNGIANIPGTSFEEQGPVLITQWGLSGPGILKLSSRAARDLHELDYKFRIEVNWTGLAIGDVRDALEHIRSTNGKKMLSTSPMFGLPKRLWQRMILLIGLEAKNFASLNRNQIEEFLSMLCKCVLNVNGKSTFKEEFVTSGGVDNKEVNFKKMESKIFPGLFFSGEVLNIDAVTGGFNFQAAWTTAFIVAESISQQFE